MSDDSKIEYAIIGGGIAGLSLGIALNHRNVNARIYEAACSFRQIGAGVGFTANAVQAMRICSPYMHESFEKIAKYDRTKTEFVYDFYDVESTTESLSEPTFQMKYKHPILGIHRAQFLDEMIKHFPQDRVKFGKRLEHYEQQPDGSFLLSFQDGSTAIAQAIIGCEGIKSHVRRCMFGAAHPCVTPSYTHKYAYRAMVPLEDAIKAIGKEKCNDPKFFLGQDGHIVIYAIHSHQLLNIVAFRHDTHVWSDVDHFTAPSNPQELFEDFKSFGPDMRNILALVKPGLDKWAIFDLAVNPPPTFVSARVALLGDAAHASSPTHGAGAGMCIEDAAVLSELLAYPCIKSSADVKIAFAVYDQVRRPRGEMFVQSSRFTGDATAGRQENIGRNWEIFKLDHYRRSGLIYDVDVERLCEEAKMLLAERMRA